MQDDVKPHDFIFDTWINSQFIFFFWWEKNKVYEYEHETFSLPEERKSDGKVEQRPTREKKKMVLSMNNRSNSKIQKGVSHNSKDLIVAIYVSFS